MNLKLNKQNNNKNEYYIVYFIIMLTLENKNII